eukprot:6354929-Pyramimonas_sp.AAC.1
MAAGRAQLQLAQIPQGRDAGDKTHIYFKGRGSTRKSENTPTTNPRLDRYSQRTHDTNVEA